MIINKKNKLIFWGITIVCLLFAGVQIALNVAGNESTDVIINEFLAGNRTGLTDDDDDFSDWIEIYNRSAQPVNLAGWSLTDDPNQPEKWPFPDVVLGSGEYLVIFASGKDRKVTGQDAALHTNFKLNRRAEFLGLYNVFEKRFMDEIPSPLPRQFSDVAYGRYGPELDYGYLATSTPGEPNEESVVWRDIVPPVEFSAARGFYDDAFSLMLSNPLPDTAIRYTTDGSEPTETHGLVYTDPIPINTTTLVRAAAFKPDYLPSYVNTHSYFFLDDVLTQPALPPGFPKTWGLHGTDFAGYIKGSEVLADYEMDPEIVNDARYRQTIEDDLKSIPTLSLVTKVQNFDIYAYPRKRGRNWERPASVELIDSTGQQEEFQINAGVRIQGGGGRWEFMPKHSFRLFFRSEYGATKLRYPLFADSPVNEFDTLVLRGGVDEGFAGHPRTGDLTLTTYTRDEWLRASQIEMSGLGSHGSFVHLYINGLYWGLYNIVERPDESMVSSYLGGDESEWYVINHRGTVSGSDDRFTQFMELVQNNDLESPDNYRAVGEYLDVTQFIDYLILNWYVGNKDWPENNWYATIRNEASGRINFFVWDGEETWEYGARIHMGNDDLAGRPNIIKIIFEALIQNPDFKMELADRVYQHLFNNGALTDENTQIRWMRINRSLDRAVVGESARWGDARYDRPIDRDDWLKALDHVLVQMDGNTASFISLAREVDYYPAVNPPVFNQQGGVVSGPFALTMSAPTGSIYFTTDGSDPRLPETGKVSPDSSIYSEPVILTTTTRIKARVLENNADSKAVWSALNEAVFKTTKGEPKLAVTEIMYNPPGGNDYEFIELKNVGNTDLLLGNSYFDEGIYFTFPPQFPALAPGEIIVLVRNPSAFAERYPGVAVGGTYQGKLSNQGDRVTLKDAAGDILLSMQYDDENGWPLSPDGRGDSLVLTDLTADFNDPFYWRASINLHGSPGTDENLGTQLNR